MATRGSKSGFLKSLILILVILLAVFLVWIVPNLETLSQGIKQIEISPNFVNLENKTLASLWMPAVDSEGKGIPTQLVVESTSGTGRIFVDIEGLLFWADTQQSMRVARLIAGNISGKDINKYDLVYNIVATNASIVGGPSAGAGLTIATIAALEGKKLNESVMITGTINHDGSIGPVGDVLEKANAAKKAGVTLFLVPLLQSREVIYQTRKHCEKFGGNEICSLEQIPVRVNISKEVGINVIEVGSIGEAMSYFFEE